MSLLRDWTTFDRRRIASVTLYIIVSDNLCQATTYTVTESNSFMKIATGIKTPKIEKMLAVRFTGWKWKFRFIECLYLFVFFIKHQTSSNDGNWNPLVDKEQNQRNNWWRKIVLWNKPAKPECYQNFSNQPRWTVEFSCMCPLGIYHQLAVKFIKCYSWNTKWVHRQI